MRSQSILAFLCAGALYANPADPTIIEGNVTFSNPSEDTLRITSTDDRSIVDWDTFSIGSTETTEFVLPNVSSAILNRVTSMDPSDILGEITANGQVFIINPNGITIDSGAVISTGAFLASTLDVDNQEFLNAGAMTFETTDDYNIYLYHYGSITTDPGDAVLLGFQIVDHGDIAATSATAGLGTGVEIVVDSSASQRITIVPNMGSPSGTGINFDGVIDAVRSEIKADGNFYQFAINAEGTINVLGGLAGNSYLRVESPDGVVKVDGTVTANDFAGDYGGTIEILGNEIEITNGVFDASSSYGNGAVYIGGGIDGMDGDLFNAENTSFGANGVADVSAVTAGNGGVVVVWADDTTIFSGVIDAKGGSTVGDGGFVQVQGAMTCFDNGTVDVTAPMGSDGTASVCE